MSFFGFRDWFFDRLIWVIVSGEWLIKIKDFKNSKNKTERYLFGLMDPYPDKEGGVIYLDKTRGTPRILIHELGHVVLGDILDAESTQKNSTEKQINKWIEDEVVNFERMFYECLSVEQKKILKTFIAKARANFYRNH